MAEEGGEDDGGGGADRDAPAGGMLAGVCLLVAACAAGTGGDAADLALPGDSAVFPGDSAIGDFTNGADLAESPPLAPEMVRVPAGPFRMGCNAEVDAECFPDEKPAHTVGLGAFDLDRLPTTRRDYQECITARACTPPAAEFDPVAHPDWPVNYISWQQAVDYCAYRHKRLPTEAEWEKAARGTDGRKYPWGNLPAPDCTTCNASPCARKSVEDVGIHPENVSPYGARDMAGNIWQWVSDWYDAGYYAQSPADDPLGPTATMGLKAKRGGAFSFDFAHLRTSTRYAHNPLAPDNDIGVRCARSLP